MFRTFKFGNPALTCAISIVTVPTSRAQDVPAQSYDSPDWRRRAATISLIRKMERRTWWLAKDTRGGLIEGQADAWRGKSSSQRTPTLMTCEDPQEGFTG